MIRTRFALLLLGACGAMPFASAQEPVSDLTKNVIAAAPVPAFIDSLYVNQWVALNSSNGVAGKLVGLDETGTPSPRPAVQVSLVKDGKAISTSTTDVDGTFSLQGLVPGTYTFVAKSDFTFATFGVNVLPASSGSPSSINACASTIPFGLAQQIIGESWVPSTASVQPSAFANDPLGTKRDVVATTKVNLQNGDLVGKVSRAGLSLTEQDLSGNVVHILQGGRIVADAPVGRDGAFRVKSLATGVYDLLIVGKNGTAAVGFQAVGPNPLSRNVSANGTRLVAAQQAVDSMNIELANTTDLPTSEEVPPTAPIGEMGPPPGEFYAPFMGGGNFAAPGGGGIGGGGAGGGGGGIGGAGGIGGLLGIAGLAVGVAALSEDDNFDGVPASIITP